MQILGISAFYHDSDGSRPNSRIHDKDDIAEEPDEVKVSSPVLKTSRSGDGLA
ncbi:MAG: hypothetical protein EBE86_022885 [Hormoscilla sp. GUM202]|nr:hypothetical protein [Hormoscilla sp. GUM202]